MRVRTIQATAFGPFTDRRLEPAEGLTVVFGENEAGKSSWAAAAYAALCGVRRGKGRPSREDSEFAERHRPWDGSIWEVSCEIELADGRRIGLHHDLDGRIDCSARDLALGRDVSGEVMFDGSPDGARYLGLDRRAFRAVAIVRQAEILDITTRVEALREHLERAAATAGADETAAAALQAIDDYRRDQIGTDRSRTRPLMASRRSASDARESLVRATEAHQVWLNAGAAVEEVEAVAEAKQATLRKAERCQAAREAHAASRTAEQARIRLVKAEDLAGRVPDEPPAEPPDAPLAARARTAVEAWRHRPRPITLEGESAELITRRLAELPETPTGDLNPAPVVEAAREQFDHASYRRSLHREQRPAPAEAPDLRGATEADLFACAQVLNTPVAQRVASPVEATRSEPQPAGRVALVVAFMIAALLAAAVGAAIAGQPVIAAALGIASVGAVAYSRLIRPRSGVATEPPAFDSGPQLDVAQQSHDTAVSQRAQAVAWAEAHGFVADPSSLRALAGASQRAAILEESHRDWATREVKFEGQWRQAAEALADALRQRGVGLGPSASPDDTVAAVARYQLECGERRKIVERTGARGALSQALQQRGAAERNAAAVRHQIEAAEAQVREAAAAARITPVDKLATLNAEALSAHLEKWLDKFDRRCTTLEQARLDWRELRAVLGASSIEHLRTSTSELHDRAEQLHQSLGASPMPEVDLGPDPATTLVRLREEARDAGTYAARVLAAHERDGDQLVSVPAGEEALAAATRRCEHVESVAAILDTTHDFLAQAQERVHRDIAPLLAQKVEGRLAAVTAGRYTEVTVDPENLRVQVRGPAGRWREASLLSHGTAEQVYFLLRVAMAEILTGGSETCPLIVDEPTVHADRRRTSMLFDVIHEVSREHQVLLFSQEDDVLFWARSHLGDRDRLIELDAPETA